MPPADHARDDPEGTVTTSGPSEAHDRPARYSDALAVRSFRGLLGAQVLSGLGDQLTRVALASLVFDRSGSAALTALVYAFTYLPWVLGATLMADLADRYPRRTVLLACDLTRAVVVAVMALPGLPLWVLALLALVSASIEPPFASARAALLPELLEGDRYVVGSALVATSSQASFVAGFAVGGVAVATVGATGTLLLDAGTFLASALLVRLSLTRSPAAAVPGGRSATGAPRYVLGTPGLRSLALLAWISVFATIAPEGLAVPIADERGGGLAARGLLLAALPAGSVVGSVLLARLVRPSVRMRLLRPLAVTAAGSLALTPVVPGLVGVAALWFVSGAAMSFHLPANAAFVRLCAADMRGRAFAVANGGLMLSQGLGLLAAGASALVLPPPVAVALLGIGTAGLILIVPLPPPAGLPPES